MEQLVLGRVVHYFDAGNGSCSTALVVDAGPSVANLAVWNHGGTQITRVDVPHTAAPAIEDTESSFHFTRDCPWGR